mgnify:CR=1 FL=1
MKVGDLVRCRDSFGIIICADAFETLVKWLDDGTVEDTDNYSSSLEAVKFSGLEVISENR